MNGVVMNTGIHLKWVKSIGVKMDINVVKKIQLSDNIVIVKITNVAIIMHGFI